MALNEGGNEPADDGVEAEQRLIDALFTPDGRIDPQPLFRAVSLPGCRHHVAEQLIRDRRFAPHTVPPSDQALWQLLARSLIYLDGERHVRLRRHFAGVLTPQRVEALRSSVTEKAESLLAGVKARGAMDLVTEFARPLPFSVVVALLGVPDERQGWLAERMLVIGQAIALRFEPGLVDRASAAAVEIEDYYAQLLDERRACPRDDLISTLAADKPDDEQGRRDVIANCFFFVEAGYSTTTSLIAGATLLLLEHPDQLARLKNDPTRIASAVEEALRLISPVTAVRRRAREDVELEGYRFPAGVERRAYLAAANRDPDVFADPDVFDATRTPNPHLAFSAGPHFCLGAPLARLEGEVAISTLVRRLPNLRLVGEPIWRGSLPLRELEHIPVVWDVG